MIKCEICFFPNNGQWKDYLCPKCGNPQWRDYAIKSMSLLNKILYSNKFLYKYIILTQKRKSFLEMTANLCCHRLYLDSCQYCDFRGRKLRQEVRT